MPITSAATSMSRTAIQALMPRAFGPRAPGVGDIVYVGLADPGNLAAAATLLSAAPEVGEPAA